MTSNDLSLRRKSYSPNDIIFSSLFTVNLLGESVVS